MLQKKIKKVMGWRPSQKMLAVLSLAALAIALIPLIRLAGYAVPWYDDYGYGSYARAMMKSPSDVAGAIKGAFEGARISWYAWQGTYSSIFFMSLMPAIWGEDKYFLGPLFLLILVVVSVFVLVGVLAKDFLKADKSDRIILQSATTIFVLMFMRCTNGGIYWYNAGIHYVGMHCFCMLMLAGLLRILKSEKKKTPFVLVPLTVLLAVLVAGANFVTTLQGLLLFLTVLLLGAIYYRKKTVLLLPAFFVYLFGFYKNVTAPGNAVRAQWYVGWGYSPLKSVWYSFVEAFGHLGEYTGFITLATLLFLAPMILTMVKKSSFSFKLPGLVLAWSFCLYATGFTPSLYSLGHAGLDRTLNAVKMTFQLLLLFNEVYWLGWLQRVLERQSEKKQWKKLPDFRACWWFYPLVGAAMLFIFSISPNQAGHYSSYGAYYYIHTGEANNFYQDYLARVALLKSDEPDVRFKPYVFKPWLLRTSDLSTDPGAESNQMVARWYGKNTVAIEESEK